MPITIEEAKSLVQKINNSYAAIRASADLELIRMIAEDPAQFYNKYIKEPKQEALTDEEYRDLIKQIYKLDHNGFGLGKLGHYYPLTPSEMYKPAEAENSADVNKLETAKEHIKSAILLLNAVVIEDTEGTQRYRATYIDSVEEIVTKLRKAYKTL